MPVTTIDRDWPDSGAPKVPAPVGRGELAARLALIRDAMDDAGLAALAIYGDREHAANLLWASGFDPRFEEALMLILPDGAPLLLAGNECLPYTQASPGGGGGRYRGGALRVVLASVATARQRPDRGAA